MKRILLSFLAVFMLFVTACASPTPPSDSNSGNASGGEQLNTVVFIYVEHRALQDKSDVDYGYVTQKVPIVAVNKLGEYLVDIDWDEESSSEIRKDSIDQYFTDLHAESYADDFVYKMLKKSTKSHTLMYVTEEQYQKLLQWLLPKQLTKIIDLTQTEDYKKNGYLDLEPDTPPLVDMFGD